MKEIGKFCKVGVGGDKIRVVLGVRFYLFTINFSSRSLRSQIVSKKSSDLYKVLTYSGKLIKQYV